MLDSAIHQINHYPAEKYYGNQYCAICWIVIYPMNSAIQHLNNQRQLYKVPKKKLPCCNNRQMFAWKGFVIFKKNFMLKDSIYFLQAAVRSEDYGKHLLDVENLLHKHSLIESQIQSQGESVQRINNVAEKFIKAKHPEIRVIRERQTLLTQSFEVTKF